MVIYIYGEDTFRSRQYLRKNIEQFKKTRDPQGYNVVILDAKKEKPGKILTELVTAPFLAERRMAVIENILSISDKELLGELITKVKEQKIPESNVVVFYQDDKLGKVKEVKEFDKILSKEKFAQEFNVFEGAELIGWVKKEIETRGGKIANPALQYLCQNVGKDMWLLNTMIDQLVAFKAGAEIETVDIHLFLEEKGDDSIFNLVDAVVAGNRKLAFKMIQTQLEAGEDYQFIFTMIIRQFKILLQMRDLSDREDSSSDTMAQVLGIHPFVVRKSMPLVKKYSMERLKNIYDQLLQIDIKTKTGQGGQSMLIDLFVGKMT